MSISNYRSLFHTFMEDMSPEDIFTKGKTFVTFSYCNFGKIHIRRIFSESKKFSFESNSLLAALCLKMKASPINMRITGQKSRNSM